MLSGWGGGLRGGWLVVEDVPVVVVVGLWLGFILLGFVVGLTVFIIGL